MSRALLALALLVGAVRAHADPQPKAGKPSRAALKLAACNPDGPPLLIKPAADPQGSDASRQAAPVPLDRSNPKACADTLEAQADSAQIVPRQTGPNAAAPNAPVSEEEARAAFSGGAKTVGDLTARLDGFAQKHDIDADSMAGSIMFDNAAAKATGKELATALKQELGASAAPTAEVPTDYPKATITNPKIDAKKVPEIPQELDSGAEPGTTLSDLPLVGGFVNRHLPGWSDTPLNPFNRASSPPAGLQGPLNPNGTPVDPSLQSKGDKTQGAPIWEPFQRKLQACRPGCAAQEYGIWRPSDPTSCHYSGAAIDLHSIKCTDSGGAKVYKAIESGKDSGPFAELVTCMRSDQGGGHLFAIWHQCFKNCGNDRTSNHMDHTHLSIGCGGGRK